MQVHPIFDRILVKPMDDVGVIKGTLVIPDIARNSSVFGYGEVIAVGPGRHDQTGAIVRVKIKEGAVVMYPRRVGVVVPIPMPDGTEVDHLLFREPEIFATVTDLPKQSLLVDRTGLAMSVTSLAKPDVGYANQEGIELARRDGWIDTADQLTEDEV